MFAGLRHQYRSSLKSYDTEENIDLAFYRPIGFVWAYLFRKLGVTPNAVTIASIFLGVGAGVLFYYPSVWLNVAGIFLLIWANSFDSADGQLARMTGNYSKWGRILDGLSGDLWFASIYIAICLRMNHFNSFFALHPWLIWLLAVVAGLCHAKQAAAADYYRQFHLFFVKGESGSELDRASDLAAQLRAMPLKGNFWRKLTLFIYKNYTDNQELMTPAMQLLRATIASRWPDGRIPESFSNAFRRASRPLMKYTNILTFNWRSIVLFITVPAGCPWIYFVVEIVVFTVIMVYMIWRHEKMCCTFTLQISQDRY